jgi:aldehyde:ferredoxin oxidoreductase
MISDTGGNSAAKKPQEFKIRSFKIDLTAQAVTPETVQCEDLEDALGGIARGFKLLEGCPTDTPYDPSATLILNLGILSGTDFMTGLRTYFHGYSPSVGHVVSRQRQVRNQTAASRRRRNHLHGPL